MKVQVFVRLKPGVLDVQGKALEVNLVGEGVENIRIGKLIELEIDEKNFTNAKKKAEALCEKVLVNPIIETFEIREG